MDIAQSESEPAAENTRRRPTPIDDELLDKLRRMKERGTPVYNSGDSTVRLLAVLLASQTFAPFWAAFMSELGRRAGETTTQVMHRVRLRRTDRRVSIEIHEIGARARGGIETADSSGMIQLEFQLDELSDEARVAMLDIDLTSPQMHGAVLEWDPQSKTWIPAPSQEPEADR